MANNVKMISHASKVLSKYKSNKRAALEAIGQAATEITVDYMDTRYGAPIRETGDLMASIAFKVGRNDVIIGSNINYAVFIHEGTPKMRARPFLRDAINENKKVYSELAADELGRNF